jgi:hypothetical protein
MCTLCGTGDSAAPTLADREAAIAFFGGGAGGASGPIVGTASAGRHGMAGCRITPVLGFWTGHPLYWVKFTFETGFELPSSCVDLP